MAKRDTQSTSEETQTPSETTEPKREDMGGSQDDGDPNDETATGLGGVLTLKRFFPRAWIIANIVPEGIGYKIGVAHIVGGASAYEIKKGNLANDPEKESVKLTGSFSITNLLTGEVVDGHTIYLPDNISRRIAGNLDILKSEGEEKPMVIMDIELGLRNIDGSIPYEWIAYSFIKDKASIFLERLRNARKSRQSAIAGKLPQKLLS